MPIKEHSWKANTITTLFSLFFDFFEKFKCVYGLSFWCHFKRESFRLIFFYRNHRHRQYLTRSVWKLVVNSISKTFLEILYFKKIGLSRSDSGDYLSTVILVKTSLSGILVDRDFWSYFQPTKSSHITSCDLFLWLGLWKYSYLQNPDTGALCNIL